MNTDDEIRHRALAMERPEDRRQREREEREAAALITKATEPRSARPAVKTKRYPHVTGVYGDSGENPSALAARDVRAAMGSPPTVDDDTRVVDDPEALAMRLDLDDLERKAKAATPGTWTTTKPPKEDGWQLGVVIGATMAGMVYAQPPGGQMPLADLEHIAAASPPVVLALVAEVRRLNAIAKAAIALVDEQGKHVDVDRGHTLGLPEDFAATEFEALVRAVEGAGR